MGFNEDVVEHAALTWLEETGYTRLHGIAIAPGADRAETVAVQVVPTVKSQINITLRQH